MPGGGGGGHVDPFPVVCPFFFFGVGGKHWPVQVPLQQTGLCRKANEFEKGPNESGNTKNWSPEPVFGSPSNVPPPPKSPKFAPPTPSGQMKPTQLKTPNPPRFKSPTPPPSRF